MQTLVQFSQPRSLPSELREEMVGGKMSKEFGVWVEGGVELQGKYVKKKGEQKLIAISCNPPFIDRSQNDRGGE